MNETQIIAKIQEIVGLQDELKINLNKHRPLSFLDIRKRKSLIKKFNDAISEIEPHLELKKFDNAVITNFKIMLLSLKFVNEKGGIDGYSFFFQKVKTALENGTN